jgi:hypothetical protein
MLEKLIKKDKNEELEKILESKQIEEHAKNLLQGILYKIEVAYRDYKKAKAIKTTQSEYIEELLRNIQKYCKNINVVKLSQKLEDEEIQKELKENKFYINKNEIIAYPIENKLLYAIEKVSNSKKIVNQKYGVIAVALSNIINTGKCIDRVEVLRDFNGWSWTTIKNEIENIDANLIYQTLQILFGKEFMDAWSQDNDGLIDYINIMQEEMSKKYGEQTSKELVDILSKISIINESEINEEYKRNIEKELEEINKRIEEYKDTKKYIEDFTNKKKSATKEIKEIEKILSQESRLKAEYDRRNEGAPLEKKIFSMRVLKQQLNDRKNILLNEIEESNYYLNPENYLYEKNLLKQKKELFETVNYDNNQKREVIIQFEKIFLQCFEKSIEKEDEEKIIKQIYQFRYFMLLPFSKSENIKDIEELRTLIEKVEAKLSNVGITKKVIVKIPNEIMAHVLKTRIIILEGLYFKITVEFEKYYVQIFDENINEERFTINPTEKVKLNKKIKIFI